MDASTPPPFDGYSIEDEEDSVLQHEPSVTQPHSDTQSDAPLGPDSESETEAPVNDDIPKEEERESVTVTDENIEEKGDEPDQIVCSCDTESAETEVAETDVRFESLEKKVDSLTATIEMLSSGLEENFARATQKAELFDRMYSEMAKYKDDLYAKLLKPFILETVVILEDYRRSLERLDTLTLDQIRKVLKNIPADLEELLENNGVDVLISEGENPLFDRKLHQVVRIVETDNPELDGKIAKKLRPGYAWNGTILRQEKVELYKLKK